MLRNVLIDAVAGASSAGIRGGTRLIKIETTKKYIEGVATARKLWLLMASIQFFLFVMAFSALSMMVSLILLLPLDIEWRLSLLAALSFAIFAGSLILFYRLSSEQKWMEVTQADDLLRKVLRTEKIC
jgi:hypothetical protein